MTSDDKNIAGFLGAAKQATETILKTVREDGYINIFSHLDADGIAAAGIIGKTLCRLDAKFRIEITQWVDKKIVGEIILQKPELVILTDFGSGYIRLLTEKVANFKILILDHHQIVGVETENFVHVNPHLFGMDGSQEISGSGIAYFVAKEVDKNNVDLAPIALVGALGDMQDKYDQRKLGGMNKKIVKDAINVDRIRVEKDLVFFGRETRPIHKALASTTNPFIPELSGKEDNSLAFLASLGIKTKHDEKWRALRDLSDEERKKLCSSLANHLLSKGLRYEVTNLIGHVYVLNREESWTPLRDAREFASLLNSTGRLNRPSLGIAVCMGDRGLALEEANKVLKDYKQTIYKYLGWLMEKAERIKEFENIYVVYGENVIDEKIVGTISTILLSSLPKPEKPLFAYAKIEDEGIAKFSSRTIDATIKKGVNLGEVMQIVAEKCFGNGGGHNIAAGAQIPVQNIKNFLKIADELVGKQLKSERVGSRNNT